MTNKLLLLFWLFGCSALFAQNAKKEGDEMVAAGNFSGAAFYYRLCMDSDEQCLLGLFKLIFDNRIEPQYSDELYQLISPLAKQGNPEAQYYLGILYNKGTGGVRRDDSEARKWLQASAEQGYEEARKWLQANAVQGDEEPQKRPQTNAVQGDEVVQNRRRTSAEKDNEDILKWLHSNADQRSEDTTKAQVVRQEKVVVESKGTGDRAAYQEEKGIYRLSGILFAIGGISAAAGATATYMIPPKVSTDWSNSDETGHYVEIKKRNPAFLIAGGIVGGVCIGAGIILHSKRNTQPKGLALEPVPSSPQPIPANGICLQFVASGNGAGLRLTF